MKAFPDLDLYRRLEDAGVTDLLCAPWMAVKAKDGDTPASIREPGWPSASSSRSTSSPRCPESVRSAGGPSHR